MAKQQQHKSNKANRTKGGRGNGQNGSNKSQSPKTQSMQGRQGKKDSTDPRINYDNARESKVAKDIHEEMKSGKFNDISWYLKNPELVRSSATIPMVPILGRMFSGVKQVPGIITYYWDPAVGPASTSYISRGNPSQPVKMTSPPDALQLCADSMYSFLVHANSRNYSYNSTDLMIMVLAGMEVFVAIENMKRAYGVSKYFEATNAYIPDALVYSLGFTPTDLRNNLGQAWFDINRLIERTRTIWIPNVFPILDRWLQLSSDVYCDAAGQYSQLFATVKSSFFMYSETTYQQGGALIPFKFQSGGSPALPNPSGNAVSWNQWVRMADDMIDALVNSEDRGIIYGDLLNAYGAANIYAMSPIDAGYTVAPTYSVEIAMQLENLTLHPARLLGIVQYENGLYPLYTPPAVMNTKYTVENSIVNFHFPESPTPEDIVEATRAKTQGFAAVKYPVAPDTGNSLELANIVVPAAAGSEIFFGYRLWVDPRTIPSLQGTQFVTNSEVDGHLMAFDWHHFCYDVDRTGTVFPTTVPDTDVENGTVYTSKLIEAYGDYDHYGVVNVNELRDIHSVAMMSLFDVPQI